MTLIYHITHLRNLSSILEQGGLWCDGEATRRNLCAVGIAHGHIKERRTRLPVPVGPGGCLGDYVPFYFAPRSPMLYALNRGAVEHYERGQEEIVHLVSSVERVAEKKLAFAFSDGHAIMALSKFYDKLEDLSQIDWSLMKEKYWADTSEDPDRTRRRQAEFLVHGFFPWSGLLGIGAMTEAAAQRTLEILGPDPALKVKVKQDWYY
jgi:hypothetical protein